MDSSNIPPQKKVKVFENAKNSTNEPNLWCQEKNRCTVCFKPFKSMQIAMQHEILEHTNKRPKINKKIKHVLCQLKNAEMLQKRMQLLTEFKRNDNLEDKVPIVLNMFGLEKRIVKRDVDYIRHDLILAVRYHFLCSFFIHGSSVLELALKDSDIDVFAQELQFDENGQIIPLLNGPTFRTKDDRCKDIISLMRLECCLRKSRMFCEFLLLREARVPILKCKHRATGRCIDINFSSASSVTNTQFLRSIVFMDERVHKLFMLLKIWAKHYRIVAQGNLTNHAFIMLVIFALQQPFDAKYEPILPCMYDMQKDLDFTKMIVGVNYAYVGKLRPLPDELTFMDLLRHVFKVFKNINFDCIISPYFGNNCKNRINPIGGLGEIYERQLETRAQYYGCSTQKLEIMPGASMCVQDIFCMTYNVASNVPEHILEYFKERINDAYSLCQGVETPTAEFLDEFLFCFFVTEKQEKHPEVRHKNQLEVHPVEEKKSESLQEEKPEAPQQKAAKETPPEVQDAAKVLNAQPLVPYAMQEREYTFHLSRDERKILRIRNVDADIDLVEKWIQIYLEVIQRLLRDVFLLEIHYGNEEPHGSTRQKTAEADTHVYEIECFLNTWQGRALVRETKMTFFEQEIQRTQNLLQDGTNRTLDENSFTATFEIIVNKKREEFCLKVRPKPPLRGMTKKSPLNTFFSALQNTLQAFNLKEYLKTLN